MANTLLYSELKSYDGSQYRVDLIGDSYAGLNDNIQSFTATSVTIEGDARALLSISLAINVIDDQSVSPNIATTVSSFSYSAANNETTINLASGTVDANHDRVTTTDAPSFEVTTRDLSTSWDSAADEILEPMKSSTTEWTFHNQNASSATGADYWKGRYKYDPESEWFLKVQKWNGASYDLYWIGNINNDFVEEDDIDQAPITIRAIDGLGRLNDIEFKDAVDGTITSELTLLDYINRLLDKNNLEQFWGASDIYIEESIEYTDGTSVMSSTNGPLENTRCRPEVFIDRTEREDIEAITCGEALQGILELFRARIIHADGKYKIMQVRNYDSTTYNYRAFYKGTTASPDATGTRTHKKTLGNADAGLDLRALAGGKFRHFPGLAKVSTVIRRASGGRASTDGQSYNLQIAHGTPQTDTISLPDVLGGSDKGIRIDIRVRPLGVSKGSAGLSPYLKVELNLNDGTNYLRQTYGASPKWTTTNTDRAESRATDYTDVEVVTFVTPPLPGSSLSDYTATLTYTLTNTVSGDKWLMEATRIYFPVEATELSPTEMSVENTTSGFSKELKLSDPIIIDFWNNSSLNKLQVKTSTGPDVWGMSGATWVGGFGVSSNFLSKIGILEAMGLQRRPLKTWSGSFVDEYLPIESIVYDYKTMVMNGCKLDYNTDVWSGTWFEINTNLTGLTLVDRPDPNNDTDGGGTSESTVILERHTNTIQNYRKLTTINGDLAAGTITSITIVATGHTRIKDGDTIFLIHPLTGSAIESFEVSADVSSTATSMSVTSKTLNDDAPNGSYVVHDPEQVIQTAVLRVGETEITGGGTPTLYKEFTIASPTDAEDQFWFFTGVAITVGSMYCVLRGNGAASVTWTVRHSTDRSATGNEVKTSGSTTTSRTTVDTIGSLDDPTIPANSFVWVETTAKGGTVDELCLSLVYTED